ncbi:TonB-dependent receptor [Novosphingobium album (ex Liu et al. 2023)]|uniref:TonB-dependent receptor n=1 Tax=Novosphingobium album (ex Liu et al. 2023) TaxID=3031130 RepID=A0ABT5WVG8_9SPHN|nr:TonB-dependent receptor [Novosphingobium album (ex Liu et al. 2023)]MDE8653910.1 TonB-dependent receptor [Novosphingobium album (ex Liu et al. 2023)]
MNTTFRWMLLGGCAAVLITPQAFAQDTAGAESQSAETTSAEGFGEILVTARRRAESLQDVPVAVSVVSSATLENNLATDLTKVAELAPQVIIGRQTVGTGAVIGIRGISSTATDPGLDQSVAVAIDNVVLSRGRIVTTAMFDLAQVEVLEGPQALFFGKNSPAGVISVTSANPTSTLEGYIRAGYEFTADERYLEGAISGPITDTLTARFALRASDQEGWMRNVADPVQLPGRPGVFAAGANNGRRQPAGQNYAGRLTLRWEPSDDFDATLKVLASYEDINTSTGYAESFCAGGQTVPTALGAPLPSGDCKKDRIKSEGGLPPQFAVNYPNGNNGVPRFKTDAVLASLNMNKKLGEVTLTSTTGYYKQDFTDNRNGDFTPYALIWAGQEENYELFTQELRLTSDFEDPLNFMVGAYFEDSSRFFGNYPDLFHAGLNVAAQNYTTVETLANADNRSWSVFGQLSWKIIPTVELSGGARYSNDRKRQDIVNDTVGVSTLPFRPAGSVLTSRFTDDNISPEVTLSWKPSPGQLIYGAYKSGYKSGAISTAALLLASATPENVQVGSETAEGFEVGYKGDLFNGRLRMNVTAYTYRFDDLQLGTFDPTTVSFRIQNAAAARTKGVSGSASLLVTDDFTLRANAGYNRARYINFADAQCYPGQTLAAGCVGGRQNLSGERLVRAPEFVFNVGADYSMPLGGWKADLSADATRSSSYDTSADNAPGGIQDAYWRLNASVHLSPEDERFRLSVIGRNLTNSYYLVSTSGRPAGTTNEFIGVFNRPREVVVQAEYRF